MGQTYLVEAKFIFKNGDSVPFHEAFKNEILSRNGVTANFDLNDGDINTAFGCFDILTAGNAGPGMDKYGNEYPDIWVSAFDASYGWHGLMIDIFSIVLTKCEPGSTVKIYPDHGEDILSVKKDGKVILKQKDY